MYYLEPHSYVVRMQKRMMNTIFWTVSTFEGVRGRVEWLGIPTML